MRITAHLRVLSNVYMPYKEKFNEIVENMLKPYFYTQEGKRLMQELKEIYGTNPQEDGIWLVYFDFYNNTIRRVLYPELTRNNICSACD